MIEGQLSEESRLLSVVVVSYNTAQITLDCLNALINEINFSPNLANKTEILVVDNASHDQSVPAIENLIVKNNLDQSFTLFKSNTNLGFAKANNYAAKTARGKYLLFLNSDTIVKSGSLDQLLSTFQTQTAQINKLGIIAARLLNPDGSQQHQGGDLPTKLSIACQWLGLDDIPFIGQFFPSLQKKLPKNINLDKNDALVLRGWIGGTAMVIERELFQQLGGFDQTIFMYGEDLDLCMRAARLGWRTAIATQAEIIHLGSASSSQIEAKLGEVNSLKYILTKHYSEGFWKSVYPVILAGCWLRLQLFTILDRPIQAKTYRRLLDTLITL